MPVKKKKCFHPYTRATVNQVERWLSAMAEHFHRSEGYISRYIHSETGTTFRLLLREFRLEKAAEMNVGDVIKADVFAAGDKIDVVGTSKCKGYAGVVKRWNAHVQCHSHGVGPVHRSVGSMGANTDPSRVMPGKKMAGHLGAEQVTVQNLEVVKVDAEANMIAIRGAVPGPKGSLVFLKNTVKNIKVAKGDAGISKNPKKASGRNPQKASARS